MAFLLLCILMLGLWGGESLFGFQIRRVDLGENRALATVDGITDAEIVELPVRIEEYFNDNLPLRTQIIYKYKKLWNNCLPPVVMDNVKGKDGHYFSNSDISCNVGKNDISVSIIYNLKAYVAGVSRFCIDRGAEYYICLPLTKSNIMLDYLPDYIDRERGDFDEIKKTLMSLEPFGVNIISLEEASLGDKAYNRKYDLTHWNGVGLDLAYKYLSGILDDKSYFSAVPASQAYTINNREVDVRSLGYNDSEVVPWLTVNTA